MSRAAELDAADTLEVRGAAPPTLRQTLAGLLHYRHLLRNLVLKDLKLKYRGSVFGFFWSLANPLLMIVVYTVAFTWILPIRVEGFVFYLMLGILAWTFFANSVVMAAGSIVDNAGLVKSVWFPRAILPTATVLFNLAQYLLTVLMFVPLMLVVYRVPPAAPMLLFPVFVALQTVFTAGVAMTIATGTAFFRDLRHFADLALAVLFWATPIVYQLSIVPEAARGLIRVTPMSPYIEAYHLMFVEQRWPDPSTWALAVAYAAGAAALGLWLVVRNDDRFAEQV